MLTTAMMAESSKARNFIGTLLLETARRQKSIGPLYRSSIALPYWIFSVMGLMHNNSSLVSQQQLPKAVKLCKEKTFSNSPNSVLWPSCASGHQVENLHTLR